MTTKHTPGPWVVDDDGDVCTDDLERLVAAVDWRHVSLRNDEALANAHLIAAAPDLLAACTLALNIMEQTNRVTVPPLAKFMTIDFAPEDVAALRAAIAKAKGEKP